MRDATLKSPSLVVGPTMKERESGPALPASCEDKVLKTVVVFPASSLFTA